ncbi:MAG: appr-1-p processing domain-containing protein [Thiothrix sp.]|nr:MAG: appr-1-p processing domain-containing protein [Thiothrix sp.]
MIEYRKEGSIFESGAQALVNPVNTVGVMGKGLALEFKNRFFDNFLAYKSACDNSKLKAGDVFVFGNNPLILNAATKGHWRNPSDLRDVEMCLFNIRYEIYDRNISRIAIPALGCGLGGLIWSDVKSMIERILGEVPIPILVFEPI